MRPDSSGFLQQVVVGALRPSGCSEGADIDWIWRFYDVANVVASSLRRQSQGWVQSKGYKWRSYPLSWLCMSIAPAYVGLARVQADSASGVPRAEVEIRTVSD